MSDRLQVAFRGAIGELTGAQRSLLLGRSERVDPAVRDKVVAIVRDVRERGDEALLELAERYDGVTLESIEVPRAVRQRALESMEAPLRSALEESARAIEQVHRATLPSESTAETRAGVTVGRRSVPLRRIGAYAPGGRAAYPSSVLMCAIPARIAGVEERFVCSPPGADGLPSPVVMAACEIAGVDRLFALGGAGAIAALAYGTESVPAVDKIVGPGSAWVEEAKLEVHRDVAIDCPAGPSEVVVIAGDDADPARVAAELLAQAEHDAAARVALLSTSASLLAEVEARLVDQLDVLPTAATARDALAACGALLLAADLDEALELCERFAPEHLLLAGEQAGRLADRVQNAGSLFSGAGASVAFGDYATGGNHVLPTGGRARAWSGLGVRDFMRELSWQRIDAAGARAMTPIVEAIAGAEGLPAHAVAARLAAERAATDDAGAASGRTIADGPERRRHHAVPAGIRATRRYDPGRRECSVELSDNTNLFGSAPSALELLSGGPSPELRRYPTVYGDRLKQALADWLGVEPENVATGCGSDDLLDASFHAFAGGGGRIAYSDPTFSMVRAFGTMNDARLISVPTDAALRPDLTALGETEADLLYLCRPDNPSGRTIPEREMLELVADRNAGVLVLDEAYAAFDEEPSLAPRAPELPGLLVLGTFSKAWGLAGLRIGYAVGAPEVIDLVERARGPYKLNALAEAVAAAALEADRDWLTTTIAAAVGARDQLRSELETRGFEVLPSAANFLFVRTPDALATAAALRERGVGVRPFTGVPGGDGIRVTAGPAEATEVFLDALDELRSGSAEQATAAPESAREAVE